MVSPVGKTSTILPTNTSIEQASKAPVTEQMATNLTAQQSTDSTQSMPTPALATAQQASASSTQSAGYAAGHVSVLSGQAQVMTAFDMIENMPAETRNGVKTSMNESEWDSYASGNMSAQEITGLVGVATQPLTKAALEDKMGGQFSFAYPLMNQNERSAVDSGTVSMSDFFLIYDAVVSRMDRGEATELQPPGPGASQGDQGSAIGRGEAPQRLFTSGDVRSRVLSGKSHYVIFGGQKMDRALLAAGLKSVEGQGDGRVSENDMKEHLLPKLLDADKLTQTEQRTVVFMFKYLRFTAPAEKALLNAIAERNPNSPISQLAGMMNVPKTSDGVDIDTMLRDRGRTPEIYGAKSIMNDNDRTAFFNGEMSLMEVNGLLELAVAPRSKEDLLSIDWGDSSWIGKVMTAGEEKKFNAGKMSAAEFENIRYRGWEDESPSMAGQTPYSANWTPEFKPLLAD